MRIILHCNNYFPNKKKKIVFWLQVWEIYIFFCCTRKSLINSFLNSIKFIMENEEREGRRYLRQTTCLLSEKNLLLRKYFRRKIAGENLVEGKFYVNIIKSLLFKRALG